jgi:hypothetical protein
VPQHCPLSPQYFIVAFIGAPFELWDLKNLHPLRTMPRKFPPITALEWSPLHNLKSLKRKMKEEREREKQVTSPTEGLRNSRVGTDVMICLIRRKLAKFINYIDL